MFLLNSCLDLFSAPRIKREDPFSLSYGANLPSSLTMSLSTPQYTLHDHVCPFAVRVERSLTLSSFSRKHDYPLCRPAPKGRPYSQDRLGKRTFLFASAPTPFNALFRQRAAVPQLRPCINTAPQSRNINRVVHRLSPLGLGLGPD